MDEFGDLKTTEPEHADGVVMPLVLDADGTAVRMFTTIATVGTPKEITLSELAIETFYPADSASGAVVASLLTADEGPAT
ncbi:MAG: hypothetical protein AAB131_18465 [Actinomycetota bacterium]